MKLNVKAMTLTAALLWAASVLLVGLANMIWEGYGQVFLNCMDSLYPGYKATANIGDVIVGTLYALLDGAIAGAVFSWLYNVFAGMCAKCEQAGPDQQTCQT